MINQQSAARSTSSTKQRKHIYLSVTYQHDRLHLTGKRLQQRGPGPQQQQSTPPILLQRVFSGEKNNEKTMRYRDECMPLTGFFRGYCQLTMTFAWRSSTTQEKPLFFPCFWCRKCISCTLVHLPPCHKICHRQKACCV